MDGALASRATVAESPRAECAPTGGREPASSGSALEGAGGGAAAVAGGGVGSSAPAGTANADLATKLNASAGSTGTRLRVALLDWKASADDCGRAGVRLDAAVYVADSLSERFDVVSPGATRLSPRSTESRFRSLVEYREGETRSRQRPPRRASVRTRTKVRRRRPTPASPAQRRSTP